MRLVPGNTFKTQWSTTSERFRDVPAATPESDEWADRPGRYSHTGIVEEDQWAEALRRLAGVVSARPIPILYQRRRPGPRVGGRCGVVGTGPGARHEQPGSAVDVAEPGTPPDPAKERELDLLRRGRATIVPFWLTGWGHPIG